MLPRLAGSIQQHKKIKASEQGKIAMCDVHLSISLSFLLPQQMNQGFGALFSMKKGWRAWDFLAWGGGSERGTWWKFIKLCMRQRA